MNGSPREFRYWPGRDRHRLSLALLAGASVLLAAPLPVRSQDSPPELSLPSELADGLRDRAPLDEGPETLARVLESVSSLPPDRVAAAARRHREARREALAAAAGSPVEDFAVTHDLLRFPAANRGRPVEIEGNVLRIEPLAAGDLEARLISLSPADAPASSIAVLSPAGGPAFNTGDRVQVFGLFLRLAAVRDAGEKIVPLIAGRSIGVRAEISGPPDRELWTVVRQNSLGVRPTESGLYYGVLRMAKEADPAALRQAAAEQVAGRRGAAPVRIARQDPFPVFVDMFQHPAEYEGAAVTLTGHARKILTYPAGSNDQGIETLHELWVYTSDSQSNPAVVVTADAPPNLPMKEDLQVPVRATGYFFKNYGYEARDTTRIAPMILAGPVEVLPEPQMTGAPFWLGGLTAALFGALFLWLAVSWFAVRGRPRRSSTAPPPDFTPLEESPSRE